jgi:hypothetical protein
MLAILFQQESRLMALPSNGITADVIRDVMPPYHLSSDLLEATFAALRRPPADASAAWRSARIARLTREIVTLKPADAGQARMAAEILNVRELADTVISRAQAPDVTVVELCRLARTAGEVVRTAALLLRTLERSQQLPVPFYGTVIEDEVDLAVVDRAWCNDSVHREGGDAPGGAGGTTEGPVPPAMAGSGPAMTEGESGDGSGATEGEEGDGWVAADGEDGDGLDTAEGEEGDGLGVTEGADGHGPAAAEAESNNGPAAPAGRRASAALGQDPGPAPAFVVTRLDQGPGWTLEVVRPRTGGAAERGAAPEGAA